MRTKTEREERGKREIERKGEEHGGERLVGALIEPRPRKKREHEAIGVSKGEKADVKVRKRVNPHIAITMQITNHPEPVHERHGGWRMAIILNR